MFYFSLSLFSFIPPFLFAASSNSSLHNLAVSLKIASQICRIQHRFRVSSTISFRLRTLIYLVKNWRPIMEGSLGDEIDCGNCFDHIDDLLDFSTEDLDDVLMTTTVTAAPFPSIWSTAAAFPSIWSTAAAFPSICSSIGLPNDPIWSAAVADTDCSSIGLPNELVSSILCLRLVSFFKKI